MSHATNLVTSTALRHLPRSPPLPQPNSSTAQGRRSRFSGFFARPGLRSSRNRVFVSQLVDDTASLLTQHASSTSAFSKLFKRRNLNICASSCFPEFLSL